MEECTLVNQFMKRYKTGASEGKIKGGVNFKGRKHGVEEERENVRGRRRGHP
jgi:hypothetical protein